MANTKKVLEVMKYRQDWSNAQDDNANVDRESDTPYLDGNNNMPHLSKRRWHEMRKRQKCKFRKDHWPTYLEKYRPKAMNTS